MSTQPNLISTEVGFDMKMTLNTTTTTAIHPTHHQTQIYKKEMSKRSLILYATLPNKNYNNQTQFNPVISGRGGAVILPL